MKKKLCILAFCSIFMPLAMASDASNSSNETLPEVKQTENGFKTFIDKSESAIKSGANKTKGFIKENFNEEKLEDFSKKATNATKKTWQDTKSATQSLMNKIKGDKSDKDKGTEKKSCSMKKDKKHCSCKCNKC